MASGDESGVVKFWHVATGSEVGELTVSSGSINSVAFDASGRRLLTSDQYHQYQIMELQQSEP